MSQFEVICMSAKRAEREVLGKSTKKNKRCEQRCIILWEEKTKREKAIFSNFVLFA